MTKKSLTDMLKEEVDRNPKEEGEEKVLRRHNPTKVDLEAITADRDQLKAQLEAVTTDRDQLKAQLEAVTTDRDLKQAHIQQLQTYLEQAQAELKAKAEIVPHKKPTARTTPRPIGSNQALSKLSDQNIGWFD
ncbi:MAG: hypothetical protein CV045_02515 [Cyanobacteria bacterium M5B4]|nr:MAG: hypothetical protein CV045_02515 [Cyanobacteria bacterium M5B4]